MKRMTMYERATLCRLLIGQWGSLPGRYGATSYDLARAIGCTPQTVTNTLLKWGAKVGVSYYEEEHRPGVMKRVWVQAHDAQEDFIVAYGRNVYRKYFFNQGGE